MTVALRVEVDGSGPALALVNGAFCNLHQWDGILDDLTPHFTVIRHDVRGTGRSPAGPVEENTFEHYADDLVAIVRAAGFDHFSLWGMAWGARVALVTAVRFPQAVDRLVLSDLGIDPADTDAQRAGVAAATAARAEAGIAEVERPEGVFDHDDRDAAARALAATHLHPDLFPFVERVVAPTLIATGEFDPNLASSRRALGGLADGRLVELPLTEHGSVLRRPRTVLDAVLPFLTG
jgi:pimeloyl-ACP methyl ester carboxylesterase